MWNIKNIIKKFTLKIIIFKKNKKNQIFKKLLLELIKLIMLIIITIFKAIKTNKFSNNIN